ncbi:hypothetical protein [Rhodohalobacter sp.]|uniref:hypothetical protein n=1 Tax=Rhodohalobacter sp. TaxID=1974210 RepID=UPI002ACD47E3|nr:hypothetical protein [Rhodohalobacter sp.]MDZ7755682.1 hypothetical protein [Rhodohalobacter sp.]
MSRRSRNRIKELFYVELKVAGEIPVFVRKSVSNKVTEGLKWCCEKRGLRIYDYTILPDRILFVADTAWGSLPEVIDSFRGFSSKAVMKVLQAERQSRQADWMLKLIDKIGSVEQTGDRNIWELSPVIEKLIKQEQHDKHAELISNRMVRQGWVHKPEHYILCSSSPRHPLNGWIVEGIDPWS